MLASAIITKAQQILLDETGVRWTTSELLGWLNEGQNESVRVHPEVNTVTAAVQLVAGTLQAIPATAIRLIEVTRNLGLGGATPGRAIRIVSRESLDSGNPDWHTDTAAEVVSNYTFDKRNPRAFFVYPPQPVIPTQVEVVYSVVPTAIASAASAITIHEIYAPSLVDYLLYRAFSKDGEHKDGMAQAAIYYKQFREGVTGKELGDSLVEPTT